MYLKHYYPPSFSDDGELIAKFGKARLVRYLNGKLALQGGSAADRSVAERWVATFFRTALPDLCGAGALQTVD